MAILVTPEKLQKMEFNVTTAEGPSRVTIVTGMLPITLGSPESGEHAESFKALLDPTLTPGQFRKATATASIAHWHQQHAAPVTTVSFAIEDAQATFDDEAGRVQLTIDVRLMAGGDNTFGATYSIAFQVTTLARV